MIQERNIVTCIILSIVTCGIYMYYWLYCVANDLNVAADAPNDTSGALVVVLGIVTCGIYLIYWAYTAGGKVQTAMSKRGLPSDSNSAILYLILSLFGLSIVTMALIQSELNKIATPNA